MSGNEMWDAPAIVPTLAYVDVPQAVEWLTRAFGFRERPGARLSWASGAMTWLEIGRGLIHVSTAKSLGVLRAGQRPCPSPLEVAPGGREAGPVTSNKASPACSEHGYFLVTASARHETCNDPIEPTDSAAPGPGRGPGGVVLVHCTFSKVKPVEGGPTGLITALQNALGNVRWSCPA